MKHTPGPWIITEGDEWTCDVHTNTEEQGIWTVASANKLRDEFRANLSLIAAAPELLAELDKLTKFCMANFTGEQMPDTAILPGLNLIARINKG